MNTPCNIAIGIMIALLLLTALLAVLLFTNQSINTPPDIRSMETHLQNHYADIQTVADYMVHSGYENILIRNSSGTMYADFTEPQISDEDALKAVTALLKDGAYLQISKMGNTIYLLQWNGLQDIGCGIAYSINGIDPPEIEYMTQLTPLSEEGWFYYVSDYNSWRSAQSAK